MYIYIGDLHSSIIEFIAEKSVAVELFEILKKERIITVDDIIWLSRSGLISGWDVFFSSKGRKLKLAEKTAFNKAFPLGLLFFFF